MEMYSHISLLVLTWAHFEDQRASIRDLAQAIRSKLQNSNERRTSCEKDIVTHLTPLTDFESFEGHSTKKTKNFFKRAVFRHMFIENRGGRVTMGTFSA